LNRRETTNICRRNPSRFTVLNRWLYQLAQDSKAKAAIDKATTTPLRGDRPVSIVNFTALAAMPARYVLERGDCEGRVYACRRVDRVSAG
jgi:hypothetical protein